MIKFKLKKQKYSKHIYNLILIDSKKTTKYRTSLNLGKYNSKLKLFLFNYSKIISFLKLGYVSSKQFLLISMFYLKNIIKV